MTLLEKLRTARIEFQNANIKKTGYNPFSKFDYFELGDILPFINVLSEKYGFICTVSFTPDLATMQISDTQNTDQALLFTSPMSTAKLTAAHDIQNLGAVQTYLRRYLYLCAFEIVEHDPIDATSDADTSAKNTEAIRKTDTASVAKKTETPQKTDTSEKTPEKQSLVSEGNAVIKKIAEIMKSTDQHGQSFFTDDEKEEAHKTINDAPKNQEGLDRLKAFVEYIEEKRASRDISF